MFSLLIVALLVASSADAVVLCAQPRKDGTFSTSVKIREACKTVEQLLDPAALDLQGPPGEPGICECSTTTTSTTSPSSTSTTIPMPRFIDNGNGTVTDNATRLMWEIKDNQGGLHDVDNAYPWAGTCSVTADRCQADEAALDSCPVGSVGCGLCTPGAGSCEVADGQAGSDTIFRWIARLNAVAFGGHTDWRIPRFTELTSILAEPFPCDLASPCVDPVFRNGVDSFTATDAYWSETTHPSNPASAWYVRFSDAFEAWTGKTDHHFVRAVRSVD